VSSPKRHHFVPESYLHGFTEPDSGFLNIYSKRSDHWRRQKPQQVMVRNKYYHQSWVPEGVDPNVLEKRLGNELEPKGLSSLRRLVASPNELDDADTANILQYLEFQRIRVPRQADMAKELAKTAITMEMMKTAEGQQALALGRVVVKDSFRFEFMRTAMGSISPYFGRMVWEVVSSEEGAEFLTSDSPVSFCNIDFPPPTEAGIGLYGTVVLFPLDSRHLLLLKHPEFERGEKRSSDQLPRSLDHEDGVVEVRTGAVWDREGVGRHNRVMYQLSQDVVVASSKSTLDAAVEKVTVG